VVVTNAYGQLANSNLQFADTKLFPFAQPGKYRIRATYPLDRSDSVDRRPALASTTVEFTVRTSSKADDEVLQAFGGPEGLAAAMGGDADVRDIPTALRRWEELVEKYPRSTYTPAIRLNLGKYYFNGTGLPGPEFERAVMHFRAVAKAGGQPLAGDALVELAKSLVELGRVDEASTALRTFLESFPQSARRTEGVRLRDGLNKGAKTLQEIYGN